MPRGYMQKSCPSGVVRAKGPAVSQDHGVRLAVAGGSLASASSCWEMAVRGM